MALDLKSGYWQVKMDEASKPLMAFSEYSATVGLLGFFKSDHIPFGLETGQATFQRLKETCLGDLQLNWCLIYLKDIIAFLKMPKHYLVQLRANFQEL